MNNIQIYTEQERGVLAFIQSHYPNKGASIEPYKLTAIKKLTNGLSSYDINLNAGTTGSNQKAIESRLPANDVFVPYGYFVQLAKMRGTDTEDYSGNSVLYSYPDNAAFSFKGETNSLMTVFHGKMKLITDTTNLYQDISCRPCYKVPLIQLNSGVTVASQDYNKNIIYLRTSKALSGQNNNKLEFRLGQGDFSVLEGDTGNGEHNYIVIDLHGFIIRSAVDSKATDLLMQKCN